MRDVVGGLPGDTLAHGLNDALLADAPEISRSGRLPVRSHVESDFLRENGGVGFELGTRLARRSEQLAARIRLGAYRRAWDWTDLVRILPAAPLPKFRNRLALDHARSIP